MKRMSKIVVIILSCCMLLVGCNKGKAPEEMAQILYNFYVQEDLSHIEALGLAEDEAKNIIQEGIESFETELEDGLKAMGGEYKVEIAQADITKAIDGRRALEKKLTPQITNISQEKNIAKVQVETTYFNEEAIYEKAGAALETEMAEVALEDEAEFVQQCIDVYIAGIIKAYETAEVSTDKKSIIVEFTKEKGMWLPTEQQAFIDHLTELTSGYDLE